MGKIKFILVTAIIVVTVSLGYDLYKEAERVHEKIQFDRLNYLPSK